MLTIRHPAIMPTTSHQLIDTGSGADGSTDVGGGVGGGTGAGFGGGGAGDPLTTTGGPLTTNLPVWPLTFTV